MILSEINRTVNYNGILVRLLKSRILSEINQTVNYNQLV